MIRSLRYEAFVKSFKETLVAFTFDIGGLFAGFVVASQLGVFQLSPWAIAIYPAIVSAKGVIGGLVSGRLSTALHLGTVHPKLFKNTKSFYRLYEALIVVTFMTSCIMSLFSLAFGLLFWGMNLFDFPSVFITIVATMALGLFLTLVNAEVAFVAFKKGLDPDIVVYPVMSTVADIFITLCYVLVLSLFFSYELGKFLLALIGLIHLAFVLHTLLAHINEKEFARTIKESLLTMVFVAFVVNVTGTVLKRISAIVEGRREIYTVYPALIDMVGDVGSVVGSTATTKLALGLLKPTLSSIKKHSLQIASAWTCSMLLFIILAFLSSFANGIFELRSLLGFISLLAITNLIAVSTIVLLSYAVSILTFKRGLDPDNFVIPVESSFADSMTSVALLAALYLLG